MEEIKVPNRKLPTLDGDVYLNDHDHKRHVPQVYRRNLNANATPVRNNYHAPPVIHEPFDSFNINPRQ